MLLFIEDYSGKDGQEVTPIIEILRSFQALNGFFDKSSLQRTHVKRSNMITSTASCSALNTSLTCRQVDRQCPLYKSRRFVEFTAAFADILCVQKFGIQQII